MLTKFETPEEAAVGLKLNIREFISDYICRHDISDKQRHILSDFIEKYGWGFFHDELIAYFLEPRHRHKYIVNGDDSIGCFTWEDEEDEEDEEDYPKTRRNKSKWVTAWDTGKWYASGRTPFDTYIRDLERSEGWEHI